MRVFGTKQVEPTDADLAAAARLSAVAARFKGQSTTPPEFTEVEHDPLGEPKAEDEPEAVEGSKRSAEADEPEDPGSDV